jgi:hypothetical protein
MWRTIARIVGVGAVIIGATGCVQTQIMKQVQVHKDASGNITGYTETETAIQRVGAFKFEFEHLKAGAGATEPMKVY